jgi:hypothetical protein
VKNRGKTVKKMIFFAATILALTACSSTPNVEEKKVEEKKAEETVEKKAEPAKPAESAEAVKPAAEKETAPTAANTKTSGIEESAVTANQLTNIDGSTAYSEVTTTTTVNESGAEPHEVVEVDAPILPTELGQFNDQDYYEYEETHGVQTFYQPSQEEFVPAAEVESFKVENGVSTFVSAASSRRFITDTAVGEFENGLYETSKRCHLRASPSKRAEILGVVPVGKLIWADDSSDRWARVYREKGPAYIHKGCL